MIDDKDVLSPSYKRRNNNHNKLLSVGRNVLLHMICLLWIIELRFRLSMKIREKRKHIIVEMGRAHKRIIFSCLHHFYNGTWKCIKFFLSRIKIGPSGLKYIKNTEEFRTYILLN